MRRVLERLLNLLAFLRTTSGPVTAERIRFTIAGYDTENDGAFRRMFERDKDLLRSMGVPLTTVEIDEATIGYVLPADEYEMPDAGLDEEERAAIWLASRIARMGGLGVDDSALYKLGGAAMRGGATMGAALGGEGDALGFLFTAVTERVPVGFDHKEKARRVNPFGVLYQRGHWYLVGETRDGVRAFRIDRCSGWERAGDPGSFVRPSDLDLRTAVPLHPWEAGESEITATVRFDEAIRWWAQRQLPGSTWVEVPGGVETKIPVRNPDAVISWLLEFGPQAELVGPPELRQQLLERVKSL